MYCTELQPGNVPSNMAYGRPQRGVSGVLVVAMVAASVLLPSPCVGFDADLDGDIVAGVDAAPEADLRRSSPPTNLAEAVESPEQASPSALHALQQATTTSPWTVATNDEHRMESPDPVVVMEAVTTASDLQSPATPPGGPDNPPGNATGPRWTYRGDHDAVSLAFVFDSTGSMWRDLEQLKRGAAAILSAMLARSDRPIHDYVFVPFNDPEVGPATVTTNPDELRAQLDAVEVHGGLDCPEPALTALLKALKLVRPSSYIYVFTDASAKDYFLLPNVLSLVQRKQTQVVFVMTGNCKDGNTPRYQSMENIAVASSGQIYHINKSEVENVLDFVKQTLDSQKVNLVSVDLPEAAQKEHAVEVDETIREFTVSVSGENPQIAVVDPDGVRIDKPPALQNILDLENVKVVAVKEPAPGSWTVQTSSDSKHAVRLTGLSVIDFAYGFSAQMTDHLEETYHRPLLDAPNFIVVGGTDMGSVWNLTSVDLLGVDGSTLQSIPLTPLSVPDGLYRGGPFVPPGEDQLFYLANFGYGKDSHPIKRITPTAISAQAGGLPLVQLQADQRVWLNGSLHLRCQIDSLLPFIAWFFKDGVPVSKKQKYQQTALMTMKIDALTEEMGGDYTCRASNVKGHSKDIVHVIVTGPPPEVITESQIQVKPHHQAILDCFVRSKLKVNVTWIRTNTEFPNNDVELIENSARHIILPNSSLIIDPVLLEDSGLFSCVAENQGGKRESRLQLIVNDPLLISVHPKTINFQKGDSFSILCEANSLPSEFYWERDGHVLQEETTGHVSIKANSHQLVLEVNIAKPNDQAGYRCVGNNVRESAEALAEAFYVETPSVKIESSANIVEPGDQVLLQCMASGVPKPTTRWLWQGRDVMSFSNFMVSEDGSLHIYNIQEENAGQLDCVGHNLVGEVKDSINLTIGSPPVVVKLTSVLELGIEGSGILYCNGSGVPDPTTSWVRKDGKVIDTRRIQHNITTGALMFSDAQIDDGGYYICLLENKYGQVVLKGNVVITGVVPPELAEQDQSIITMVGKVIELTCRILAGKPNPSLMWSKHGNHIDPSDSLDGVMLQDNGSLIIHRTDLRHSGVYKCEATNAVGSTSHITQLYVMDPPILESSMLNLTEKVGNNALLPCHADGTPQPDIQWLGKENSPIALTERILQTYEGLIITGVQADDAGKYTCVATNPAGSANQSIVLTVQDPPHIVGEIAVEIVANVGDVIQLPCDATGEPTPEFLWYHNYEYFSFSNHILPSTNSDGLVITSVHEGDGGQYLCSAVNDAGSANKTVTVIVQERPSIDVLDPSEVIATSGLSAKLTCRARGVPEPRIIWTFKGQPVKSHAKQSDDDEFSLNFSSVNESDTGPYICTAYNLAGSDARAVKLTVQVMPTIDPWQDIIKVLEGQDLVLNCHMYGIPFPQGSWVKDGLILTSSQLTDTLVQYKVVAKISDAGRYECKAENVIGNSARVTEVSVLAPPQTIKPSNVFLETVTGNDVILDCITPQLYGYPHPSIRWIVNGDLVNSSYFSNLDTAGTLHIKGIMTPESGVYLCFVQNEAGNSSRTFNLSVQEPPLITEDFMHKKTLIEGEDFSIRCSASGVPEPTISWVFNNQTLRSNEEYVDLLLMNDNTLVIISAQTNTSGVYTCFAQNEVGEDKQQTQIEVYVPPTMTRNDLIYEEVNEGDDVMLTCPSSDASEIQWKLNGEPIDFTANERSDEAHFKLVDGGKTLAVFESRPTDNGTYTCIASNPVGSKEATFFLEVLWAPFFEEFGVSKKEVTVVEGASVTFDCLSNGNPTPKVIWKVNESMPVTERTAPGVIVLPSSRYMLTIPAVQAHHGGLYTCKAINRVGFSNKMFLLHVTVPPYLESDDVDLYEVLRGESVTLSCPVMGLPKPSYVWDRLNNSRQSDWDRSKMQIQKDSQALVISDIDFPDGGVYICNGSNQAGFKLKYFNVSIMGLQKSSTESEAPTIIDAAVEEELNAVEGGSVSLKCTAHGQPLPDIQWSHNGYMLPIDNPIEQFDLDTSSVTQILALDVSNAANSGRYVCHATNNRGAAEKVYRIHFQIAPRIDGEMETVVENLTSVHGLPFNIHCISIGEPAPIITWYRAGVILKSDKDVLIEGVHGDTLHFKRSYQHHTGTYTCSAKNNAGNASKIFHLDVQVPPFHPNNTVEVERSVLRHESLNLQCDFKGYPIPQLMWIKGIQPIVTHLSDGPYLTNDNHELVIPSTELSDTGRYSCLASNEAGSAELMFHVRVSEPPKRNEAVTSNFSTVTLRPLRRFMLLCAMSGSPPPSTTWFKDNSLLHSGSLNGSVQISSDGRQLHIFSASHEHEGLYKCHAENTVGSSGAFFQLILNAQGDWGDWSDWSLCSAMCGFGTQERQRKCLTTNCLGESLETRPCLMSYCPINGGWSNWTNWSPCDRECGHAIRNRTRECTSPKPAYGGLVCEGNEVEMENCNLLPCPVNGGWSSWAEWSTCNVTCGVGIKIRHRYCTSPEPAYGGLICEGNEVEMENCNLLPCPVNGGWSSWSEWSTCSVTCGVGIKIRHRYCNSPEPAHDGQMCFGLDSDVIGCNDGPCLGAWSDWSEWTLCSASCGPGMRQRHRKCNSSWSECIGDNQQYEYCKLRRCGGDNPRKANLRLRGNLNGYNLRNDTLYVDISRDEYGRPGFISTRLHKREATLQPIVPLLLSPVSWNVAYEDNDARNGYSLTKGLFNQDSHVKFATGQQMKMRHVGEGVDSSGELQVLIEVIGEVPYTQPKATIFVQPFSEDYIQTGVNNLFMTSEGALTTDGHHIPYSWNSNVSYLQEEGTMPYLLEKLSTDRIETNYDSHMQEMRYTVSTVISKGSNENKCPEGFKLNIEHQHCEDVDECLDSASNKCHSTQLCENLLGSYRCSCPSGFRSLSMGSWCLDVNECLQEPLLCSHECRNVPGSYHCLCPPGTYLLDDRHSCSSSPYWDDPDEAYGKFDLNREEIPNHKPHRPQDFMVDDLDLSYSYDDNPQEFRLAEEEWACQPGLIWEDGQCVDQDECLDDPDICGEDETCLNMFNKFKCLYTPCGVGFKRDPVSRDCVTSCLRNPCGSGAELAEKEVFMAVTLDPSSNELGMDIAHLSVSHDLVSPQTLISPTKYYFENNRKGKLFQMRQEQQQCVLQILKKLKAGKVYRIEVRGDTFSKNSKTLLFSTKFTLFFHVLDKED